MNKTTLENAKGNDIKHDNYRKKMYLRGYRKHGNRIKRIEAEIEEIRSMKLYPSVNNDGMPHGSACGDLSDYASKLTELEEELYQEGVQQVKEYKDISFRIGALQDENERDTLFYRYIKDMGFWEIAKEMGYSERQIHRFHGSALKNLKIPKDVSPCQSDL